LIFQIELRTASIIESFCDAIVVRQPIDNNILGKYIRNIVVSCRVVVVVSVVVFFFFFFEIRQPACLDLRSVDAGRRSWPCESNRRRQDCFAEFDRFGKFSDQSIDVDLWRSFPSIQSKIREYLT
jgi:hypothetical protein